MRKKLNLESESISSLVLDEEQIALRRVPLEDSLVLSGRSKNWYCSYCTKNFSGELTFMKHHCEPRRRALELVTPLGQAAYGYYREWMRLKKFSQPSSAAFLESRYYRAFINFSQLVINANISKPDKFLQLMVQNEILPILWCRDSAYAIYLDWVDKLSNPLDQVQESINYLFDICEKESCNMSTIFSHMGSERVLSLIRQRRLSPWLIFCSPKFGTFLKSIDKAQLSSFNTVVNSSYWAERFQKDKLIVSTIKEIVKEVGL